MSMRSTARVRKGAPQPVIGVTHLRGANESGDNQDLISQVGSKTKWADPRERNSGGMSPKLGFCGILWVWRLLMLLMTSCTGSMLTI